MSEDSQSHVEQDVGRDARVAKPAPDVEDVTGEGEGSECGDDADEGGEIAADEASVDE